MGVIKGFCDPADELYQAVERELARLRRPHGRESQTLASELGRADGGKGDDRALFAGRQAHQACCRKGFDTADFVADMRDFNVTPHVAQNSHRRSAIHGRTSRPCRYDGCGCPSRERQNDARLPSCR